MIRRTPPRGADLDRILGIPARTTPRPRPRHPGAYTLCKDGAVVATFTSPTEALSAGDERFGNGPFLVHNAQRRRD